MKQDEFKESLNGKSVRALLDLLKTEQAGGNTLEPEFIKDILIEIDKREISYSEKYEFDDYNKQFIKNGIIESIKPEVVTSLDTETKEREPNKYTALKSLTGIISFFGYITIVAGIIGFFVMLSTGKMGIVFGIAEILISVVIALPLLAFSNLIWVFIDIEYNTRKISEK